MRLPIFLLLLVLLPSSSAAEKLGERLQPLIDAHQGKVAVAVKHLESGKTFAHRADEPMPTASLIKLAVMIEAYRQAEQGDVDLDKRLTLRESDKVPGSGILTQHFAEGLQLTLRDAIRLMIAYSDNTATNLVLDQIGIESVARTMERLGCPNTKIHAKVFRGDTSKFPERSRQFGLGSTTAHETLKLLELLHHGEAVSKEASEQMLAHLRTCQDDQKLGRFLPEEAKLAHKSGSVSAVRCDAGIMQTPSGPVAICVLTSENEDHSWGKENAAELLCGKIAREVYTAARHSVASEPREAKEESEPHGVRHDTEPLQTGASGKLVEDLQRTLNARLSPSPELSIDGDFGPMTEEAVKRFQREHELDASGKVDEATWKALSPLVTQDEPVADPEVVNAEPLEREPPESLDGPPLVTCKAWAVADGKTGELLWGDKEDEAFDMASTTKIMTALLVVELAERDASVLDEQVTFSERADKTIGSTAGIRAGERLPVGELLYGLLLPSGNDASVALAEHFGSRADFQSASRADFQSAKTAANDGQSDEAASSDADPLDQFIAAMNQRAEQLGMSKTRYANPHGLTDAEHRMSARDLVRLAYAAMQKPLFRKVVSTRQRGATLTGPGGYQRNVLWKNTNRLLRREGYEGVKTGTTEAAGACLVSYGQRGDDRLLVVVLGSASSAARYIDTRNLFRWAWREKMVTTEDAEDPGQLSRKQSKSHG